MSIRRTLLATILGGLSVVLLVAGAAVYLVARAGLQTQLDATLVARARTFASLVTDDDGELDFEFEGPLRESDLGVLLRITADDGSVIACSPLWPAAAEAEVGAPAPGDRPALGRVEIAAGTVGRHVVVAGHASIEADAGPGAAAASERVVIVEIIGRTDAIDRAASAVLAALIAGGLFAAAGAAGAVWVGVRRGLRPMRRLDQALDTIGPDGPALPTSAAPWPVELAPTIAALEGLLQRLREAMERERRFTDAAAHELRTPIAELKTVTDVADRWPEPERLRRSVREARAVAEEMDALLETLLAAARGGSGFEDQAAETVPLLPLARTVAETRLEPSRRRRVSWVFEGDEVAAWRGPRGAILAIVRNLIDNAAEYTPEAGAIRVAVTTDGRSTSFSVENGPVALEAAEADRIFEPFWRADPSRTSREHRGLGLSIVAALGEVLRLRRQVTITPEGSLRVRFAS